MAEVLSKLSDDLAEVVETAGRSVVRVEARRRLPASGIAWSTDGLVVTANHVVERDDEIIIGTPDGESVKGSLVGRDPTTDIAVIRTEGAGLTLPDHDGTDGLKVGHIVLALGRPGKSVLATMGIVSALGDSWRTGAGGRIDSYLQTDVVMYPGFSGGAAGRCHRPGPRAHHLGPHPRKLGSGPGQHSTERGRDPGRAWEDP